MSEQRQPDNPCILAIDQGTTSSRAIVFDSSGAAVAVAQREFAQYYPGDGWVEHDPEDIWASTLDVSRRALAQAQARGAAVVCIGIANQRETAIVWERESGRPIYNAIVWQDRRTADRCEELRVGGCEADVRVRTGLVLDPYFSAAKIAWILDHVEGARQRAERGALACGTVDTFLIWRLTGGRAHVTDATNASRTSLYNIETGAWDESLCALFGVPEALLARVCDSCAEFGVADANILGAELPILGVAGDQQAASVGQACFAAGDIKSTYGTGCFVMLNTGALRIHSQNRLLSTIAYQIKGARAYALEGSIFIAGAAIQWLRDGLGLIDSAAQSEDLARTIASNNGVYLVPAFTGLGAPHWRADARGALFGLTRATGRAELARAAIEASCYQTNDLFEAMAQDGVRPRALRVDGGMTANDWMCQFLADILGLPVDRPRVMETTALGAAYLAGLQGGIFASLDAIAKHWALEQRFLPDMDHEARAGLVRGWRRAVTATMAY